ncbi:MAG: histidine triad nucleotide-binding protein, partial [Desulfobacteraceae bacterium]|nr:histidine triad nucleotide-binding protein [Desulfobacteraceae bacterium]
MSDNCLFCKIVAGQIPTAKLHEDDELLAFADINPQAP